MKDFAEWIKVLGQVEEYVFRNVTPAQGLDQHHSDTLHEIGAWMKEQQPEPPPEQVMKSCNHFGSGQPMRCPFKTDVLNDSETLCICCDACQWECEQDI